MIIFWNFTIDKEKNLGFEMKNLLGGKEKKEGK
jgi:hypothetical protein